MYFWKGIEFGIGFAVVMLSVYMLWILLPDKPPKRYKIKSVREMDRREMSEMDGKAGGRW